MDAINDKRLVHFCTGCGLCEALGVAKLEIDEKGFSFPASGDVTQLQGLCPSVAKNMDVLAIGQLWGKSKKTFIGWSCDSQIRSKASSGGILTELLVFLLEKDLVDEVIQCSADEIDPTKTKVYFSDSRNDVIQRAGSRYSISHPLSRLSEIDTNKKYAFVGKPCDVAVLRNYLKTNEKIREAILYVFSFFCMGTPSVPAQKQLLNALSCPKCTELSYRGDGWPGYTVAKDVSGQAHTMTYGESWGKILGRDLMPYCKFCIDGIGEEADIACGDAWYQLENGKPDFSEHDGRNIVFARSERGVDLLNQLLTEHRIELSEVEDANRYLGEIQISQKQRRQFLSSRLLALKFLGKPVPIYSSKLLSSYAKGVPYVQRLKSFLGTLRRGIQNKV